VGYAFFAAATNLWVACAWVCFAHMGGSTIWVASTTLWQRHVQDAFRGRVFALEFLGMTLSFGAGGLVAGLLYDAQGSIEVAVWSLCAVLLVMAFAWRWSASGRMPDERLPETAADQPAVGAG